MQRAQLKQNLGLVGQFGGQDDDLVADEDLLVQTKLETAKKEEEAKKEAEMEINTEGMSARQRNAAKRRAKKMAKEATSTRGKETSSTFSPSLTAENRGRNLKTVVTDQPQSSEKIVLESVVDSEKAYASTSLWPFQDFCEELCHDLFKYT